MVKLVLLAVISLKVTWSKNLSKWRLNVESPIYHSSSISTLTYRNPSWIIWKRGDFPTLLITLLFWTSCASASLNCTLSMYYQDTLIASKWRGWTWQVLTSIPGWPSSIGSPQHGKNEECGRVLIALIFHIRILGILIQFCPCKCCPNFHSCPHPQWYLICSSTAEGTREQNPPFTAQPHILENQAEVPSECLFSYWVSLLLPFLFFPVFLHSSE